MSSTPSFCKGTHAKTSHAKLRCGLDSFIGLKQKEHSSQSRHASCHILRLRSDCLGNLTGPTGTLRGPASGLGCVWALGNHGCLHQPCCLKPPSPSGRNHWPHHQHQKMWPSHLSLPFLDWRSDFISGRACVLNSFQFLGASFREQGA